MKKLNVKGRYLEWDDGNPFFYLADTAWELFHRLDINEAEYYLRERNRQGFNAIQAVALAEHQGVTVPNAYGRLPLKFQNDSPNPEAPDCDGAYSYWAHVDAIVKIAEKFDLFMTILPTWGDKFNLCWGKGPEIFTEKNAYLYGKWIAERYKNHSNIIWMLGGDRPLESHHRYIIDAMAKGIKEVDSGHLVTFHPPGAQDSTNYLADADYIDFHTAQTGHGIEKCYESDAVMLKMAQTTDKPYMDSEPRYEDHPACFNDQLGYEWNADDIRQNAYWNVLSGACGHTYGNHNIWSMNKVPQSYFTSTWQQALTHTGAEQVGFIKKLRLSRDYFSLVPCHDLICNTFEGMGHLVAAKGKEYAYVYTPLGLPFTINPSVIDHAKYLKASWFNPRTGKELVFTVLPPDKKSIVVPPSQGKGADWVLILDAMS